MTSQTSKADATVGPGGKVEVNLPLPTGTTVEVFVYVPSSDSLADLIDATRSATGFWDNPMDDEDWNAPDPR